MVALKTLVRVETGGGGAQEVKIDLMPPGVPKVSYFSLLRIIRAASSGRHESPPNSVFLTL